MRALRSPLRSGVALAVFVIPVLGFVGCAHESHGVIEGDLTRATPPAAPATQPPSDAPPPPKHERVRFTWQSEDGGLSGQIQTSLPDGEVFQGKYHEITQLLADRSSSFCGGWGYPGGGYWYGGWYGGPWTGPGWYWGGAWPYHGSCDGYITYYSGQVVAMLEGDRGTRMRCHFTLDEGSAGMIGGGFGECQVSNGDRITAMFDRSDATTDPQS